MDLGFQLVLCDGEILLNTRNAIVQDCWNHSESTGLRRVETFLNRLGCSKLTIPKVFICEGTPAQAINERQTRIKILIDRIEKFPDDIYIKPTHDGKGRLIRYKCISSNNETVILSGSAEPYREISDLVPGANADFYFDQSFSMHPEARACIDQSLELQNPYEKGTYRNLLFGSLLRTETIHIETVIPYLMLGELRVEFRVICVKEGAFRVAAMYAKTSRNRVAANLSLEGEGQHLSAILTELYKQQRPESSDVEIRTRSVECMGKLTRFARVSPMNTHGSPATRDCIPWRSICVLFGMT